jgi:hypothetical protein
MMQKLLMAAALLGMASAATAAPVQWTVASGGNGNYYEYIQTARTWADARAAALASSYLGNAGYLATVTSAAENAFIGTLASDGWLGGTDQAVEGQWRWADGPEAGQLFWTGGPGGSASGYSSWNAGEPNDFGGEDFLHRNGGAWNDLPGSSARGYFVEYSAVASGVPEPATWAMMIAGFGLVGASLRRRSGSVRFA